MGPMRPHTGSSFSSIRSHQWLHCCCLSIHPAPFQALLMSPFYTWGGIAADADGTGLTSDLTEQHAPSFRPHVSCSGISRPPPVLTARLRHQNLTLLQCFLHPIHGKHQLQSASHHPPSQGCPRRETEVLSTASLKLLRLCCTTWGRLLLSGPTAVP